MNIHTIPIVWVAVAVAVVALAAFVRVEIVVRRCARVVADCRQVIQAYGSTVPALEQTEATEPPLLTHDYQPRHGCDSDTAFVATVGELPEVPEKRKYYFASLEEQP